MQTKPYHQMTPAERLTDRMAKNRKIEERADAARPAATPARITERQTAVRGVLDKFQQIKKTQGIDAASDFVLSRVKK